MKHTSENVCFIYVVDDFYVIRVQVAEIGGHRKKLHSITYVQHHQLGYLEHQSKIRERDGLEMALDKNFDDIFSSAAD